MEPDLAPEEEHPRRFSTTRWSVILAASADSEETARRALAELCHLYWRPIFAFICQRGHPVIDAQDLTQDFFLTVIDGGSLLRRADPERGRFRSLVLKSVQNFLIDAHAKRTARKRGGGIEFVPWDDWMAEAPSHLRISERTQETASPERIFDIRWAATVVEHAMARLQEECAARGRRRIFDSLNIYLSADRADVSYADLASRLGIAESAVKRLLHQLRVRYRDLLREEVARTIENDADVEDEIRYLCTVLASHTE